MSFDIGERHISEDNAPFIIAEVGSNFETKEDCLKSIEKLAHVGADAVKFQLFDSQSLYGRPDIELERCLDPAWLPELKDACDANKVEFMCSAFSPEFVLVVDQYVNAHKIASAEMNHPGILGTVAACDKPTFISMAGHGADDIRRALDVLSRVPTVLMYCVAGYPSRMVNLARLNYLRNTHNVLMGYSDHTTDALMIPALASSLGAVAIEKHVNAVGVKGPDADHSLSLEEFRHMVAVLRSGLLLGDMLEFNPEDKAMRDKHHRRLVLTKDVKAGDVLWSRTNYGVYRALEDSRGALTPWEAYRVEGQTCREDLKAGTALRLAHVQSTVVQMPQKRASDDLTLGG